MARRRLQVGKIAGLYGVKGWVKVYSDTDPRENIVAYSPWQIDCGGDCDGDWREVEVAEGRRHSKTVIVRLKGCECREAAQQLLGCEISIWRDQLAPLQPGEYYWADLEGLDVITVQGVSLGQVQRVFDTGANHVLSVRGERERLIPLVEPQYVKKVDFDARVIEVDWDPEF